jgi:cholesterol transport system auxiliary component
MLTSFAIFLIAERATDIRAAAAKRLFFRICGRCRRSMQGLAMMAAIAMLAACSTPQAPIPKAIYDFGPMLAVVPVATASRLPALALPEFDVGAGLDSPAMLYRLQYADSQQLRPYAQARWSVPPAQLVRARLRDALSTRGPVLSTEGATPWVLRIELDEFSQLFSSPGASVGIVRLRASLMKNDQLIAQTSAFAQAAAPSQDAAGGVRALRLATDDAVGQIANWLTAQLK